MGDGINGDLTAIIIIMEKLRDLAHATAQPSRCCNDWSCIEMGAATKLMSWYHKAELRLLLERKGWVTEPMGQADEDNINDWFLVGGISA